MQAHAWWIIVAGPIVVAAAQFVRRKYGTPWLADTINKLLTEFRDDVFARQNNDAIDRHRVTLFRHRAFRFPKLSLGWLEPVARSGHLTQRGITWFKAPDRADRAEGVAGRAWRCQSWIVVPNPTENRQLPNIDWKSNERTISEYAESTFVTPQWVQQRRKAKRAMARSFCAIRVQVKGKPWGVLVLDSQSENPPDISTVSTRFSAVASVLSPLLERV